MTIARWRWISIDPKAAWGQLPAIVCIHGGGWANGNRANHGKVAQALAARGYVTATISYRLSGEAPFPAAIHDCKAAVRFLRANAKEYGIDPDNIGAIGLSAGGHLTALLATSPERRNLKAKAAMQNSAARFKQPYRWARRPIYCPNATERFRNRGSWPDLATVSRRLASRQAWRPIDSPLRCITSTNMDPPCWFITGENRRSQHACRYVSTTHEGAGYSIRS